MRILRGSVLLDLLGVSRERLPPEEAGYRVSQTEEVGLSQIQFRDSNQRSSLTHGPHRVEIYRRVTNVAIAPSSGQSGYAMQPAIIWEAPNHPAKIASGHAIAGIGMRIKTQASVSHMNPATTRAMRWRFVIVCDGPVSSPIVHSEQ